MSPFTYVQVALSALLATTQLQSKARLLLTNDDGWATAQIRAQNDALNAAGFNVCGGLAVPRPHSDIAQVILSAPAEQESGTGSDTATPTPLTQPCEFNTCPAGSPAEGFNASNREPCMALPPLRAPG